MSEPDIAVRAVNLRKAYTLYPSPWERMREILGFRRRAGVRFPEHVAVDGVDLTIQAGEKVGFIGRNGAGKSTLLKLITGVIEPTSGRLEIRGQTHALLQMGAGFHQEFTGRQNAYGYLANLGLSGAAADQAFDDIVAFSELEEYIDQPLKTYSTGMQMRLIFAASTAIAPRLFVVDEVLGVGDAYFQHKSFNRIQELCEKNKTTLLLVSHDIYTAAKLCDRMIWIDRGRIKFDGEPKTALNLYESSIKEQEEQRLRKKAAMLPAVGPKPASAVGPVIVELTSPNGKLAGPVDLVSASLVAGSGPVADLVTRAGAPGESATEPSSLELVEEGSSWQVPAASAAALGATPAAVLNDHGSIFQKGQIRIRSPLNRRHLHLRLTLATRSAQPLVAVVFDDAQRGFVGCETNLTEQGATEMIVPLDTSDLPEFSQSLEAAISARHGTGDIRMTRLAVLDDAGQTTALLDQSQPFRIAIDFQKRTTTPVAAEIVIAFQKEGVLDAMRAFGATLNVPGDVMVGQFVFDTDTMPLSAGKYTITAMLARQGYYASDPKRHFTLNSAVIDVIQRENELQIRGSHPAFNGTIVECRGRWRIVPVDGVPSQGNV